MSITDIFGIPSGPDKRLLYSSLAFQKVLLLKLVEKKIFTEDEIIQILDDIEPTAQKIMKEAETK